MDTNTKLEQIRNRGIELLWASYHIRAEQVIGEFSYLVEQWRKRIQAESKPDDVLSEVLQDETSDFAKHIFGENNYAYFGSEICMLIEKLFGVGFRS